jgi:chromosome segregation protein
MLKRLELVGFKSFADKTQFDFPSGITAIVGPNGSGKSNVVDAVRWILGEQSAKSLRGGEMADVIFNGSTSRRSLGLAEVTMTFDNNRRTLATEADEVQITRRVYGSGEGEYLINQQLCRLKDIKELFLGSGAGTDAYCIIEQGRVDVLLQASTRERRTIFEEAAGISRFKAKKVETLRKLERVDQNLLRLRDIQEEVEKQLGSVKLQAAKAQRYQEYSDRLKELRIHLGLEEFHQLSERLQAELAVLEAIRQDLAAQAVQADALEQDVQKLEAALAKLEDTIHDQEGCLASARQQMAAEETTLTREQALSVDLEADLAATRSRLNDLHTRVAALAEQAARAGENSSAAEKQTLEQRDLVHRLESELHSAQKRLAELQIQIQTDQTNHLEQMRQAARLHNEAVSYQAQMDNLHRERDRLLLKSEQAAGHLASLDLELQQLARTEEMEQAQLTGARQGLADQRMDRERLVSSRDQTTQLLADLRAERSGLASRIEILEGLERSHEGLGTGVRELMALLETGRSDSTAEAVWDGARDLVLGIVADFLTVRHEYAPLIDLVLGDQAQHFLVRDMGRLTEALLRRSQPFTGRVTFTPVTRPVDPAGPELEAHPAIIAVADQVVTCSHPDLAHLPSQLLGRTLIVRDLDSARALAPGYRLVTLQGELVEANGTMTVGGHHAELGILSRKSELRELREQAERFDRRIADTESELASLRDRIQALNGQSELLQREIDVLAERAAELRSRLGQHRERREGLHEEVTLSQREIHELERESLRLTDSWQLAKSQAEAADRQVHQLQTRLEQADTEIRQREQERQDRQQEVTTAKVTLAQVEERLHALRAKQQQIQSDLDQRLRERAQGEEHLASVRSRLEESQRVMLRASSGLAHAYWQKESAERQVSEMYGQRDQERQQRQAKAEQAQLARSQWRERQEQAHARELESNEIRHRRDSIVDRIREDYQLELADLYQQASSRPPDWDSQAANEEITELRRKLSRLGSVNLDSLQELAELETRASTLQTQADDLVAAKRSLEEIIATINQDSRRLFIETLASIRTHFQELFRKLFGGGMADILLEDENDILESGIEIIARPPGKELRSISLMSGGEKTLTAVALLLAVFRSKPSPFCILDEVDAALDEANIGRFTAVLHEFLDQSQFIIITHSKKTMAVADVLYGVTMQESGVSKRVAVRFEDWPDETPAPEGEPVAATRNGL